MVTVFTFLFSIFQIVHTINMHDFYNGSKKKTTIVFTVTLVKGIIQKKKTFKIESFLYLKFKKKLILPEDGDVEIIARSNIWSLDVMAEENESEQQIVNV